MRLRDLRVRLDEDGNLVIENDREHQQALQRTGFWGKQAAGALFFCSTTSRVGLALRSGAVLEPHTYGTIGGAIDDKEDPLQAVRREVIEEIGYQLAAADQIVPLDVFQKGTFRYTTFLVVVEQEFHPEHFNWENDGFEWFAIGQWPRRLHPGVKTTLAKPQVIQKLSQYIRQG